MTEKEIKEFRKQNILINYKKQDNDIKIYSVNFKQKNKSFADNWLAQHFPGQLFDVKEKDGSTKATHYTYETDRLGKHKVIEQMNGISVKLNIEPSPEYKAILDARGEADAQRRAAEQAKQAEEKLIQDKMRELAIKQLKQEGKL